MNASTSYELTLLPYWKPDTLNKKRPWQTDFLLLTISHRILHELFCSAKVWTFLFISFEVGRAQTKFALLALSPVTHKRIFASGGILASHGVQLWWTLTGEVVATTNSKDVLKRATNRYSDFLLGSHSALPTYRLGTQWSFAVCDCTLNIWCISQSVQQGHCGKVLFSMAPHPSFWWMQGGSSSCWWCTSEEIACVRACSCFGMLCLARWRPIWHHCD